jgi:ankyrin
VSIFRIASPFLIFLLLIIYPTQAACSGYDIQVDPGVAAENGNLERAMTPGNDAGLDWNRLPGGYAYADNANGGPIRLTQMLKEISDQEHRIAQFINAARLGDVAKVDKFLSDGMDINAKNRSGNTALMEACASGHLDVINLLLDRQADPAIKNNIGETATSKAIRSRQYRVFKLLVDRKALQSEGIFVEGILHGDAEFVERMFRSFSEPVRQRFLANQLHVACRSGKVEVVKLFLDKGADPNQNKGRPLCSCSSVGGAPVEAIKLLLDRGADPNLWEKESALIEASHANRPDVVRLLLERGANINAQEKEKGKTALMEAVEGGASKDPIVKILLEKGADIRITNKSGYSALGLASRAGRVQAAQMLLDKGANINVKSKGGWTPLHEAASVGSIEMVEFLLQRGADATAKTEKGNKPLDIASQRGHKKVEAILRGHGTRR